jgi:prepilin-type N-terminal cleavage/methylation domain-containing protein
MNYQLKRNKKGFTIIEVMIVLAIAGLIMAIVFLAVPALQRNAHNNSRRSDASHLAGLVNEYAANHAGALPTTIGTAATDLNVSTENWAIMTAPVTADMGANNTFGSTATMRVNRTYTCNSSTNTLSGGNARTFSISYQVETSGAATNACIQG